MAVTRADKTAELESLEGAFKGNEVAILIDYKGINVPQVTQLRSELRKAKNLAPRSSTVREMLGLSAYRTGQWEEALRELRTFRRITGDVIHMPVEMDCLRALGRPGDVTKTWNLLQDLDAPASVGHEARVVYASFLLDQGKPRDAWQVIKPLIPVTIELAILSTIISVLIGVPTGVVSAVRQDTAFDYALRVFSLAGLSMPSFWLGMVIILMLAAWLGWIPPVTYVGPTENFKIHLVQFLLPSLAVGYRSSALITRITRSAMLEVLREDYVRTAWAKGQTKRAVVWQHALKNAMLPVITVIGIEFAFLIGGLVVTETVFNLSGVGRTLYEAITGRDYVVIQGFTLVIAVIYVITNLVVDISYGFLDPRVRLR